MPQVAKTTKETSKATKDNAKDSKKANNATKKANKDAVDNANKLRDIWDNFNSSLDDFTSLDKTQDVLNDIGNKYQDVAIFAEASTDSTVELANKFKDMSSNGLTDISKATDKIAQSALNLSNSSDALSGITATQPSFDFESIKGKESSTFGSDLLTPLLANIENMGDDFLTEPLVKMLDNIGDQLDSVEGAEIQSWQLNDFNDSIEELQKITNKTKGKIDYNLKRQSELTTKYKEMAVQYGEQFGDLSEVGKNVINKKVNEAINAIDSKHWFTLTKDSGTISKLSEGVKDSFKELGNVDFSNLSESMIGRIINVFDNVDDNVK